MTALIDLDAYCREVEAFAALAEDFLERASFIRLGDAARDLRTLVGNGIANCTWRTDKPIEFRASTRYDGPSKTHHETSFSLGFALEFRRPARIKRRITVWHIEHASTHVSLKRPHDGGALDFHFDYKNALQWGPQLHCQVNECIGKLPIPRLLATTFLPTDCADMMLCELHHEDWLKRQRSSTRDTSLIRDAQQHRTMAYVSDISKKWSGERASTRVTMLQDYTAAVVGLPDSRGRVPAL